MKEYIVNDMTGEFEDKDYQELIRCKDCKYNKNNKWVDCPNADFFGRTLDNYCSLAERKDNGRTD